MSRVVLSKHKQIKFFQLVKEKSVLSSESLGKILNISGRSYRDWSRAKTLPTLKGLQLLSQKFNINLPEINEIREENWSGRINGKKGAIARLNRYGSLATIDGCRKGGRVSQKNRHQNPEFYRKIGCKVRNDFFNPARDEKLAEFIGVVLGDGCLTKSQCQITLHKHDDIEYAQYLLYLINNLFGYRASIIERKENAIIVLVSGVNFIEKLQSLGLRTGNKVENQVDIPCWIKKDKSLYISCIKGLFDTDGGTIKHKHTISNREYLHFNLCFSNHSKPLLRSFQNCLQHMNIKSSVNKHCVVIYNTNGILRFFEIFKPNNTKHLKRYQEFLLLRGGVR